jgi:hypothetical protein
VPCQQNFYSGTEQGDQIGRMFAYWVNVYFSIVFKIAEVGYNWGLRFSMVTAMY